MPTVGQIAGHAGLPASIALKLLGASNPVTAGISAGITLLQMVDKIGQGRKSANKFTQNGGPQDIINKQLAAISSSQASPEEKAQAADQAWRGFLQSANDFAAKNPKQSTVVHQAIYNTPALTQTVSSLMGGQNPLDESYTNLASQGMAQGNTQANPGPSWKGTLLNAGIAAASPFVMSKLAGEGWMGTKSVGDVSRGVVSGAATDPLTGKAITSTVAAPGAAPGGGLGSKILTGIFGGGDQGSGNGGGSLLSRILPNVISSGTSLLSGVIGSHAATQAANLQSDSALEAAKMQQQSGREALAFNRDAMAQQQKNIQPWIDAGSGALRSINEMLADPTNTWSEKFAAPTADEAMKDPGIDFQLKQGQRALEAYERANGTLISGKAIKDINDYAQGVAAQGYQNVFNRDVTGYNTRYNTFANERAAKLNPLLSEAGLGETSTAQLNNEIGQNANSNANIGMTTAGNVGNLTTSAANSRASGYVGSANSWLNSLGQIGSNLVNTQTIQQMLSRINPARAAA